MQPPASQWTLSSCLPLAVLVLALAVGSWGVFAGLVPLIAERFELTPMQQAVALGTPALAGIVLFLPLYRWARRSTHPEGLMRLAFLGLVPVMLGLANAGHFVHLLLVGIGLGLVPGCFAAGLIYLRRLTGMPLLLLLPLLAVLSLSGAGLAYLSTSLIADAFGWRLTPLISIALILIASALLGVLGESPEPRE